MNMLAKKNRASTVNTADVSDASDIEAFSAYVKTQLSALHDPLLREHTKMKIQNTLYEAKLEMYGQSKSLQSNVGCGTYAIQQNWSTSHIADGQDEHNKDGYTYTSM
jgi:hypothetical protein